MPVPQFSSSCLAYAKQQQGMQCFVARVACGFLLEQSSLMRSAVFGLHIVHHATHGVLLTANDAEV